VLFVSRPLLHYSSFSPDSALALSFHPTNPSIRRRPSFDLVALNSFSPKKV